MDKQYNSLDEVPKNLRIEHLNLAQYAAQCTTDILDLADPKYNLVGKYVKRTYDEDDIDYDEYRYLFEGGNIRIIKNIDKLNFKFCTSLDNLIYWFDKLESIEGINNIDTSNVESLHGTFEHCISLQSLDLSKWDISKVESMCDTFAYCKSLTTLNIDTWNTSNVKYMIGTFRDCESLEYVNVYNFDMSNVITIQDMFYDCKSLKYIDIENWNTSNITSMYDAFCNCNSLERINTSKWDKSKDMSKYSLKRKDKFIYPS